MAAQITDDEVAFYREHGYVRLPGVLTPTELAALRAETGSLIDRAARSAPDGDPWPEDFVHRPGPVSGAPVLTRVEYVVERLPACRALLGHPFLLRTVERMTGADLVPTWDSMVVKMPGEGVAVPWHRDERTSHVGAHPIFNVDLYLDAADGTTALWVLPGSHRWDDTRAWTEAIERSDPARHPDGFDTDGATQVRMEPGDVLLHDVLLVHGSPASSGNALRRVLYFEFRTAGVEVDLGPHVPAYVPRKQQILLACLAQRASGPTARDEVPFVYLPPAPYDEVPAGAPPTYRVPHAEFWRA